MFANSKQNMPDYFYNMSFQEIAACVHNVVDVGCVVKVLEKRQIVRERKTQYVKREKEVLMRIDHPFFVKLHFTFQDEDRLCIFYHHS